MGESTDELGPLPKGDRNAELEQLSRTAMHKALDPFVDKLWYRDERVHDTGVDLSLEVKVDGHHTNLRAQVQMKSTEHPVVLENGTVSLQVETSNLNYLLNGPSPLYVLYLVGQQELRYAWARDERRRIEAANPDWADQGTVTLRFVEQLTPQAILAIRERILREARFTREIHDTLVRMPVDENVTIKVESASLQITDTSKIERLLAESGLTLVASGFPRQVVELADRLGPPSRDKTRIRMVLAYAEYMRGRYTSALGHIAEASIAQTDLSTRDREFLDTLKAVCDYVTGRITREEYVAYQNEVADRGTDSSALHHRLESVRYSISAESDRDQFEALLVELDEICARIEVDEGSSRGQKLQARLARLLFEGTQRITQVNTEVAHLQVRSMVPALGMPDLTGVNSAKQALLEWNGAANAAVEEAFELKDPVLVAEALFTRLQVQIQSLFAPFAEAVASGQEFAPPDDVLATMKRDCGAAAKAFSAAGILDRELDTKMLMADLCEMIGQHQEAVSIASDVLPIAKAMEYDRLASLASEILEERSLVRKFANQARRVFSDKDECMARMTDEEVRKSAQDVAAVLQLPAGRIPVLERDYFVMREAARQHVGWCRHLEILQDKRHERSKDTLYAQDPNRKCVCTKYQHETSVETPHWQGLLTAFKDAHCLKCDAREPRAEQRCRPG